MVQEIITYVILTVTLAITLYRLYKFFYSPVDKCQTCYGKTTACKLQELKKVIKEKEGNLQDQ